MKQEKPSVYLFDYATEDLYLTCEIEYDPGEAGSRSEPGEPPTAHLLKAFYAKEDFYDELSERTRSKIEQAFLARAAVHWDDE